MKKIIDFIKNDEGVTVPEYALMLALIAATVVGSITLIEGAVTSRFTEVAGEINSP